MPNTVLWAPPDFQTLRWPAKNNLKNNAFYLLILDVSQIQYSNIRTIQIQIEKNIYKPKIKD